MRWLDRLDSLSYRVKMPVTFAAAAVVGALVVALGLTYAAFEDSEKAFTERAARLAETAARALPNLVLKDELWSAFELVRGFATTGGPNSAGVVLVVADVNDRVFVSNDPNAFPVASRFRPSGSGGGPIDGALSPAIWQSAPILSNDDDRIGTVYVRMHRPVLLHEFVSRAQSVGIWALIALAILLPVGWYAGNRMAKPLVQLAEALHRVGANPGSQSSLPEHPAMDEVGLVTRRFNEMTRELAQSETLKQEAYRAERLAAVGRLAGGVAHEINNPLAGLLNAIDTQRRHGARDVALSDRTLDLLERGLNQIRQTVAALLVEVRAGDDQLSPADFEDLMTLVEPGRAEKDVVLDWQIDLPNQIALPAAQVRQVALNLLLNAIDATPRSGKVQVAARVEEGSLHLIVSDQGDGFAAESLSRVFEPFQSTTHGGEGLGLRVTHQLVQDLNGDITVARKDDHTFFQVKVPIAQTTRYDAANLSH
jgi:signal transduction histidine kinase